MYDKNGEEGEYWVSKDGNMMLCLVGNLMLPHSLSSSLFHATISFSLFWFLHFITHSFLAFLLPLSSLSIFSFSFQQRNNWREGPTIHIFPPAPRLNISWCSYILAALRVCLGLLCVVLAFIGIFVGLGWCIFFFI